MMTTYKRLHQFSNAIRSCPTWYSQFLINQDEDKEEVEKEEEKEDDL